MKTNSGSFINLFNIISGEVIRVFDGNASMKRRLYRTISVPKNAPAQAILVRKMTIIIVYLMGLVV